jgi:hypothetical protein
MPDRGRAQAGHVVSVAMTDRRNDAGCRADGRRYRAALWQSAGTTLVDTYYATVDDIAALAQHWRVVEVYLPPAERDDVKPQRLQTAQRAAEPDSVKQWRSRMATEAGEAVYRLRKLIERVNANTKNHGFGFLPVRGLIKAKAVALWHALAHNLVTANRLRPQAA